MADPDLKAIWQQNIAEDDLPSVASTARQHRKQSLNLVERIKRTAKREHRTFLVAATIGLIALSVSGYYYWALGVLIFTALMMWKYEVEMRLFNRIKPENSILEYLQAVSRLLRQFMRNYQRGILVFIPMVVIGSAFLGQWLATGRWDPEVWTRPVVWLFLGGGIAVGILFSRWWLKFWVKTLYGQKMKAMEEMIEELSGND